MSLVTGGLERRAANARCNAARVLRQWLAWLACLVALLHLNGATAATAPEYQLKAVFVYNFSRFVGWPEQSLGGAKQPFVIGILGDDPFGPHLDDAVRGETINQHPLVIRHYHDIAEVSDCQILFIDRSEEQQLPHIVSALDHRSTLTVSDLDDASSLGVMIQLATVDQRIRLRINAESARAAGLTISAPLLQLAQIVHNGGG